MECTPRQPVPVFPLPDLALFPATTVPLHIFELRYRTMVRDALSGERLLALAVLKPGWERDYEGSPAYHDLGCLASFEDVQWLPNDCYDLVLGGVSRVRLGRVTREFPYRACRVELLPQAPYTEDDPLVLSEKQAVVARLAGMSGRPAPAEGAPASELARRLAQTRYETLVNLLCMQLRLKPEERLELLALDSVLDRGRRAQELAAGRGPAPPRTPGGEHN